MRIPNLDAYKGIHDRAMLNSKSVLLVFGYKINYLSTLKTKIDSGAVPKPDKYTVPGTTFGRSRAQWNLGKLRKLRNRMQVIKE